MIDVIDDIDYDDIMGGLDLMMTKRKLTLTVFNYWLYLMYDGILRGVTYCDGRESGKYVYCICVVSQYEMWYYWYYVTIVNVLEV